VVASVVLAVLICTPNFSYEFVVRKRVVIRVRWLSEWSVTREVVNTSATHTGLSQIFRPAPLITKRDGSMSPMVGSHRVKRVDKRSNSTHVVV